MPAKPQVIALEEHYLDPDVVRAYAPEDARQARSNAVTSGGQPGGRSS
jgi:hypothetical protein